MFSFATVRGSGCENRNPHKLEYYLWSIWNFENYQTLQFEIMKENYFFLPTYGSFRTTFLLQVTSFHLQKSFVLWLIKPNRYSLCYLFIYSFIFVSFKLFKHRVQMIFNSIFRFGEIPMPPKASVPYCLSLSKLCVSVLLHM